MTELAQLPIFESKSWFKNKNSIWMLTRFELKRNLKTHFFPHRLEVDFVHKLSEMLSQVLKSSPSLKKVQAFKAKDLTPDEKQLLYEHYLPTRDFSQFHHGEMFLLDPLGFSYITLNIEDHLHFHAIEPNDTIEESLTDLLKLEYLLSESLEFAYSPKFGFMTADPRQCGTALTLETYLHVPALIHLGQLEQTLQKINRSFFNVRAFGGSLEEALGDLLLVSNGHTLGLSEETLLKNIRRLTLELVSAEKTARERLSLADEHTLKDKVGKAFGILKHSSKLSLKETLSLLSLCKLGLELGWLEGISLEEMNTLFFSVRKGRLALYHASPLKEEQEQKRPQIIQKQMKFVSLKL